jgi:hypothetical protein
MFSASPISLTDANRPSSSIRCHRHARASALTSVPSGCGFDVGTIALPSGATIRLRPPGRWRARSGLQRVSWQLIQLRTLRVESSDDRT